MIAGALGRALALAVALADPEPVHKDTPNWILEEPLTGIGGDVDAMYVDPWGGIWTAVTGETTAAGRARVLYRAPQAAGWELRYEGPTATDLSLHAAAPGELYLGFNQPMRAFAPTLLRLGADGALRLPAPADRLDDLEHLQVGDYALASDRDGWACGQHGALWRLRDGAWARQPSPFAWAPGDPHGRAYCVAIELSPDGGSGLMITSDGMAASFDGAAWRRVDGPDGRAVSFLPRGRGLAFADDALLRHTAGGWVRLADRCDAASAGELRQRSLVLDRGGALGMTRDLIVELGAASWSCRPSGLDVGLRAVAASGGALWVLSDDGVHRATPTRIVAFADAPGAGLPPGLQYPLVVDLDLDGDLDVLAALGEADVLPSTVAARGSLALWQNLGDGAFRRSDGAPAVDLPILPGQVVAGDLDGDADLDLVTRDVRGRVTTWRRDGDRYAAAGTWAEIPGHSRLDLADLEGDGDLDVLTGGLALVNDGVGRLTATAVPGSAAASSRWFDVDGDGDADVVALRWRDPAIFLRNDGDAGFTEHPLGVTAEAGVFADLDRDGVPEFLAQRLHYYHLALPFRRCALVGEPRCDAEDPSPTPSGTLADLNADGDLDVVVGSLRVDEQPPRSGEIHLGGPEGFVDVTYASGLRPRATPFDCDGDGDLDLYTVAGGLALQRGAPRTWLRVRPRQVASDRLASGAWVVVRDAGDRVVASGIADAGALALGLPDADARYAVTVRFPGGATRTVDGVGARTDLEVYDVVGLARGVAHLRLWATGTWLRVDARRDLLLPLAALALALLLLRRSPRLRPWSRVFAAFAALAWPLALGLTVRAGPALAWLLAGIDLAAAALLTAAVAAIVRARRRVRVGPFRLRERLGAGAAATVWRAERGGEDLALKLYERDVMESSDARERFFREARIGSEIQHPNLVQIVDAGRLDDGRCYLAMKRIDGEPLTARLAGAGRLAPPEALRIAMDIAGALAALHDAGVVHRDVKPANVVVDHKGRAVLTDLGLARGAFFRTVTRLDVAVGTLAYMSPEQAIGRPLDGRADLWSLGVVLYELLGGARPFVGQHELELIYLVCNVDPPALRSLAAIPEDVEAIVTRCLARQPADRYADAAALRAELARALQRLEAPRDPA
ncbi:MAG: serine/threonine-protein kinase [Nannocystaceae bacterium]